MNPHFSAHTKLTTHGKCDNEDSQLSLSSQMQHQRLAKYDHHLHLPVEDDECAYEEECDYGNEEDNDHQSNDNFDQSMDIDEVEANIESETILAFDSSDFSQKINKCIPARAARRIANDTPKKYVGSCRRISTANMTSVTQHSFDSSNNNSLSDSKVNRSTTIKNKPSWIETQPKLNAKSKSGYILFSAEVRKRVMNENPDAGFGEVSRIVGNEWKRLSDDQKREYEARAQYIAAERVKAELLTPNSKLPQPGQIRVYCCRWQQCDFQFDTHDGLYEHIRASHASQTENDSLFVCLWNSCLKYRIEGKPFPSLPRLLRHVKEKHLPSSIRHMFPNQRAKNYYVYVPARSISFSSQLPSTSNDATNRASKSFNNHGNEEHGHFLHHPYGDEPADLKTCSIATSMQQSSSFTNAFSGQTCSGFFSIPRQEKCGQNQTTSIGATHVRYLTANPPVDTKSTASSVFLNGAFPSHVTNSNSAISAPASTYQYVVQQQSSMQQQQLQSQHQQIPQNQGSTLHQQIAQQTVFIPAGQQAIIVNGMTVYIPNNAQTVILPAGYTGPQQQHQIVVHTQPPSTQHQAPITGIQLQSATSSKGGNAVTQQNLLQYSSQNNMVNGMSSLGMAQQVACPIQSPCSTISSLSTNQQSIPSIASQHPQLQHSSSIATFKQQQQQNMPAQTSSNQHYPIVSIDERTVDSGKTGVSLATMQHSKPVFVEPSKSVNIRRVLHSEVYVRYLESMYNSRSCSTRNQHNISKWDKTLMASAQNTIVPDHNRLPFDWIQQTANGSWQKEEEMVRPLWLLREQMIESETGIGRSRGVQSEVLAPKSSGYDLPSLSSIGVNNNGGARFNSERKKGS